MAVTDRDATDGEIHLLPRLLRASIEFSQAAVNEVRTSALEGDDRMNR
jgi:hypothetical protein